MNAMKKKHDFIKIEKNNRRAKIGLWIAPSAMAIPFRAIGMNRRPSVKTVTEKESTDQELSSEPVQTSDSAPCHQITSSLNFVATCPKLLNPLLHTTKVQQGEQSNSLLFERQSSSSDTARSIPMTIISTNHVDRIVH